MKKLFVLMVCAFLSYASHSSYAQSPYGRNVGFGIMVGDPVGVTLKYWNQHENAFVFDLGSSYFGSPRIDVDYLWHFDAFRSDIAKLYAGPGMALGFGKGSSFYYSNGILYGSTGTTGLGVRGVFGVNIIPRDTPLEIFFEAGLLVGLSPDFGSAVDAALGLRFYP
jgi:hypothetical protein